MTDAQAMAVIETYAEILPLYLYDHGGITMSCSRFSCPWDSGQVGWIYIDKTDIDREFNGDRDKAAKSLVAEVETYDTYLTGDVYGYTIEDEDGETLDSCWGFFGIDYVTKEVERLVESYADDTSLFVGSGI